MRADIISAINRGIAISFIPIKDGTVCVLVVDPSDGREEQESTGTDWNGNILETVAARLISRIPFEKT